MISGNNRSQTPCDVVPCFVPLLPPWTSVLPPPSLLPLAVPRCAAAWRSVSSSVSLRGEVRTVAAPQFAESVSEGDVRWEKGMPHTLSLVTHGAGFQDPPLSPLLPGVGDFVEEDEVIAEIETDKVQVQNCRRDGCQWTSPSPSPSPSPDRLLCKCLLQLVECWRSCWLPMATRSLVAWSWLASECLVSEPSISILHEMVV